MKDFKDVLAKDTIVQRTDEWFALREKMLTASDAATAIGKNPYSSPKQLLISKRKPASGVRFETEATRHGTKYEDEAIEKFCEKTGHKVHAVGIFVHPEHDWLGGSPDGLTETCELIEVKCPLKREIKHEIPEYYYPQVQLCMEILDIDKCHFIQYHPSMGPDDAEILDILEVPRSKAWFAQYLPVMRSFWDDVLAYRAHPKWSTALYGIDQSKVIDFSDVAVPDADYAFVEDDLT